MGSWCSVLVGVLFYVCWPVLWWLLFEGLFVGCEVGVSDVGDGVEGCCPVCGYVGCLEVCEGFVFDCVFVGV